MAAQTKTLYGVITLLIAIVVITSSFAGLYYYQYGQEVSANQAYVQQLREQHVKYLSNISIDYGNGTSHWYNNTSVQPGWNLYVTTQVITDGSINATYYPEYSSHIITAIYNVADTSSEYWLLWTYNATAAWQMAQVGPDQIAMTNGSIYAWTFCGSNCPPP